MVFPTMYMELKLPPFVFIFACIFEQVGSKLKKKGSHWEQVTGKTLMNPTTRDSKETSSSPNENDIHLERGSRFCHGLVSSERSVPGPSYWAGETG